MKNSLVMTARIKEFIRDITGCESSGKEQLIKELTDSNEQLEQFAYVAAHDLREPLRIIVCFTDLLLKENAEHLGAEALEYMAITRRAAKKMEALVSDLLEYGQVGQEARRYVEIDSNKILNHAVDALETTISSARATIQHDRLPTLISNPLQFSRLLQNLIGNAIKYQLMGNSPLIRISAQDKGANWQFAVTDNGIGIKPEYLETIFMPFNRLHGDDEFAGTGLGLSICRKIVEDQGGTLWAESTYGTGSTFFFTLPKRTEAPLS